MDSTISQVQPLVDFRGCIERATILLAISQSYVLYYLELFGVVSPALWQQVVLAAVLLCHNIGMSSGHSSFSVLQRHYLFC